MGSLFYINVTDEELEYGNVKFPPTFGDVPSIYEVEDKILTPEIIEFIAAAEEAGVLKLISVVSAGTPEEEALYQNQEVRAVNEDEFKKRYYKELKNPLEHDSDSDELYMPASLSNPKANAETLASMSDRSKSEVMLGNNYDLPAGFGDDSEFAGFDESANDIVARTIQSKSETISPTLNDRIEFNHIVTNVLGR